MALPQSAYKDREFLAVIGDEDTTTGLLLAGVGVRFWNHHSAYRGARHRLLALTHEVR